MLLALGARLRATVGASCSIADDDARQLRARPRACSRRATKPSTRGCSAHDALRVGIGGPVGSGKTALTLVAVPRAARPLRHRGRHQRHLHRGGRAVPGAQRGARARAHHRRGDRRLPAHRDPRGRVDQPRGGRPADAALPGPRPDLRRVRRRQPRRDLQPRALRPDALRDRRRRRRQDPAQGRARHHQVAICW